MPASGSGRPAQLAAAEAATFCRGPKPFSDLFDLGSPTENYAVLTEFRLGTRDVRAHARDRRINRRALHHQQRALEAPLCLAAPGRRRCGQGAGLGCWVRSMQSVIPLELASRWVIGSSPKVLAQNFTTLTWELSWWLMCAGLA